MKVIANPRNTLEIEERGGALLRDREIDTDTQIDTNGSENITPPIFRGGVTSLDLPLCKQPSNQCKFHFLYFFYI